jgi:phosphatidylinositol alpha-1,6-mannosyltransferase
VRHLLVTNDFPPKVGGIQSYLWELWRRLPAEDTTVLTTPHPAAAAFDAAAPMRIVRDRDRVLLPHPRLRRRISDLADEAGADLVLLDPALPLGLVGPSLGRPYGVVVHGAEVTVPRRLPGSRALLRRVLDGAEMIVAAGPYPAAQAVEAAGTALPVAVVPPGVDTKRFAPLGDDERRAARRGLGLPAEGPLVVGVSRLVPRKGFDVLIRAAARLRQRHPDLLVAIAGEGRDKGRLERLVEREAAPVRMLGRVSETDLPALYGCADLFAMLCRDRWLGMEQEGFGIVFLEAAASGVAQLAGASGGAADAVADGDTGVVVQDPRDVSSVARELGRLLSDPAGLAAMGRRARVRAVEELSNDVLAARLASALQDWDHRER